MELIICLVIAAAILYWISSRLGRSREYSRSSTPIEAPVCKRALSGTFDESYFVDPKTGAFRFPKYRTDKKCIVQIKDITKYKDDMWYDLDVNEKKNFGIADFEFNFVSADIEIDGFWNIFDPRNRKHLGTYQYLTGHGRELEELNYEFENRDKSYHIFSTDEWMRKLLDNGCLRCCIFESEDDKRACWIEQLNSFKVSELKEICSKNGLKINLNKQGLINQIISSGLEVDYPPAVEANEKFQTMMDHFYLLYVDDVYSSIDRWHPLVIREVWDHVVSDADSDGVAKKAKEIIASKYFEDRLRNQPLWT